MRRRGVVGWITSLEGLGTPRVPQNADLKHTRGRHSWDTQGTTVLSRLNISFLTHRRRSSLLATRVRPATNGPSENMFKETLLGRIPLTYTYNWPRRLSVMLPLKWWKYAEGARRILIIR